MQVEVAHPQLGKRRYAAKGVTERSAAELKFFNDEVGAEMTIAQYYEHKYHIRSGLTRHSWPFGFHFSALLFLHHFLLPLAWAAAVCESSCRSIVRFSSTAQ